MKVFVVLLIASCAILSVKADEEQESQGPPEGPPGNQQPGPQPGKPGPPGPHMRPAGPQGPPPPPFNDFKTPQLNEFVNRIIRQGRKLKDQFGNRGINSQCVSEHIRSMFVNYNVTLKLAGDTCVTDDMKALPDKANNDILSCMPTPEDLQKKRDEAKANFDALIEKLKAADEEISAMSDALKIQIKITDLEWTELYTFYTNLADTMFNDLKKINECVSTKRTEIQAEVIKYLDYIEEKCPQQ